MISNNQLSLIPTRVLYRTHLLFQILGYYESESDDIDVPLSKRINRLNIENTGITNGSTPSTSLISVNNSASAVSNMHAGPTNNTTRIDYENRPYSGYPNLTHDQRIQNMWQRNHDNSAAGDVSVERTSMYQEPVESSSQNDRTSMNHGQLHSSSFREKYNYPENSQYYHSNHLLYSLFQERQTRQNNDT